MMMQEGMGTVLIVAVTGHLRGEGDHLVLTKEKEEALIMVEVRVLLLHTERKGAVLNMDADVALVLTRNQGVAVPSMVGTAGAMRALAGGRESRALLSTAAVQATGERG
jgi:hypothetical protein